MTSSYPTDDAWAYFLKYQDDIRSVVNDYGSVERMEIPNTRVADRNDPLDPPAYTGQRDSMPLAKRYGLSDFDLAVVRRDSRSLSVIMNDAWLRLPEQRSVYQIPGVTEMCNLLDCTVDGFDGPDDDEESEGDEQGT